MARFLYLLIRKEETRTLNEGCFLQYLASCSWPAQSQKPVAVYFKASVPPRACSSLRIALLWLCLSFCNRTANIIFSHEEERAIPWCSIRKMKDCYGLYLITRCQGFKTEQVWRVLLLQMLLVLGCKTMLCFPASHQKWVRGSRQWECCFSLFFPSLAVIRAGTGRRLVHTLGLVQTCHRVCEVRVSTCMCKMH